MLFLTNMKFYIVFFPMTTGISCKGESLAVSFQRITFLVNVMQKIGRKKLFILINPRKCP